MLRAEVLKLYRDILRTVKKIPDEYYRNEMKCWARDDFKNNKHLTDEVTFLIHNDCKFQFLYIVKFFTNVIDMASVAKW